MAITTQFLAVALVLAPCALAALLWVRSKSDGEEPDRRINGIAWIAALAAGGSLALGSVAALGYAMITTDFNTDGWPVFRYGIAMGVTMYVSLRVFLYGVGSALHRWACRLAKESVDTFGHRLLGEAFTLGGFLLVFVSIALVVWSPLSSAISTWALVPLAVGIFPVYNTFLLPWFQFFRAPPSSARDLTNAESWLEELRLRRKLPEFRIRVQEGRLVNAFATAGLGAHLVVIGGGLLDRMSHVQLRAVLAHEVAHVEKGHVPRRVLPLMIVGTWLHVLCVLTFATPLFDTDEFVYVLAGSGLAGAFAGLFLAVLPGFFMRKMEFQADRLAVEMLGDGEQLVDALTKLAELNKLPLDTKSWSHPSMQARIDAIRGLAPHTG